jgi:hypothetical protein
VKKLKLYIAAHKREVAFGAVIFFVASLAFALGYTASRQFNHALIVIEKCSPAGT